MPRDILGDSLAVLRILEHEDEESCPLELEDKPSCKQSRKSAANTQNGIAGYTKDDCACYYNYAQQDPLYQYKTCSLPAASSMAQPWDERIRSALQVSPEDIANQLTLLDLPCFKAIRAEELTTCSWNKKNKQTVAPNVVAFTKRFNRVSFWTVLEILNGQSPKARAEILAHFIKIGKKLHELNNLHSLYAVISALQSASIYRLNKTWACLSKKDKQQFDKLAELFCAKHNWSALRTYLNSIPLPCIPYLGLFLTDLVYIDDMTAGSPNRSAKMEVILRTLEHYQESQYDVLLLDHVAKYLNSVRYIEELQKFVEDDQYKLSVKLEPPSPIGSCAGSKESVKDTVPKGGATPYTLSPSHRLGSGSLRLHGTITQNKFIPTHRKCRSLGSNIFGKSHTEERMDGKTPCGSVNLLDDTLLESPTSVPDAMCLTLPQSDSPSGPPCELEGFVRRKTLMRLGRKPALPSWQRYWLQISGDRLTFYHAKSFKGSSRADFKLEPCKVVGLDGWRALWSGGAGADTFQLAHHHHGTLYKFKTVSEAAARQWVTRIELATNEVKHFPANLMSFE